MNQTTALGPALARRSHGVSVPGAPMRATFPMRSWPPANAALGSHPVHWFPATEGTSIRGERFSLAAWQSHYAACDRPHTLSARRLSNRTKASCGRLAAGLFYA